jgi:hypothetical protein
VEEGTAKPARTFVSVAARHGSRIAHKTTPSATKPARHRSPDVVEPINANTESARLGLCEVSAMRPHCFPSFATVEAAATTLVARLIPGLAHDTQAPAMARHWLSRWAHGSVIRRQCMIGGTVAERSAPLRAGEKRR